jgi:hypothetical protein
MRIYVFLADLLELCTKTILSFLLNLGLIFAIEVSENKNLLFLTYDRGLFMSLVFSVKGRYTP